MISGGGREVRQSERELRQILDLTPQHITEFGPDGRRLYTTARSRLHGLTHEEWKALNPKRCFIQRMADRVTREQPGNFQSGSGNLRLKCG